MNRFRFPMQIPEGHRLSLTQPFGPSSLEIEPKGPNGEPHFHYGVDVQDINAAQTYGTPLVCPFKDGKLEGYYLPGETAGTTPWLKLTGTGASGRRYSLIFAHVSATFFRASYNEGDIFALAGNAGLVTPSPTPSHPFDGAHLHFGVVVDGEWCDPLQYFDIENPYRGAGAQPESKLPRLRWALETLQQQLASLLASHEA